jgi:hypothetical protein
MTIAGAALILMLVNFSRIGMIQSKRTGACLKKDAKGQFLILIVLFAGGMMV